MESSVVSLFKNYRIESGASVFIEELNFEDASELHLFENAKIEVDSYVCIKTINVPDTCLRRFFREAEVHPWATVKIEGHFFSGNPETEKLFFYNNFRVVFQRFFNGRHYFVDICNF